MATLSPTPFAAVTISTTRTTKALPVQNPAIKNPPASGDMVPVTVEAHVINADGDAAEIGDLYRRSRGSMADGVRLAIQCGQKLIAKKQSLAHGQWLRWLDDNAGVLGFNTDRTARLLMAAAKRKPASDLNDTTALMISRTLWGQTPLNLAPKLDRTRPVAASRAEPELGAPSLL